MESADQQIWARARKHAEDKAGFFIHLGIYAAVNTFFVAPWRSTGGRGIYPWFIVPMATWGNGVVAHFVGVFAGPGYVERATQREYQRLRGGTP